MTKTIAIIGAGPAGLIAAEKLASAGFAVDIYDQMPSPGRKFLMAGRGGLNLTHSEPLDMFVQRYGTAAEWLTPLIAAYPPQALRDWCEGLGEETFIGSSGRVFPRSMKAAPLLRAWLRRLDALGVRFHPRHRFVGWQQKMLHLKNAAKEDVLLQPDATLLALGGASWPRLGSDGHWCNILQQRGIALSPLRPSNCGFTTNWSDFFRSKFAGTPIKPLAISCFDIRRQGEALISAEGIEGGLVYALSSLLRDAIAHDGFVQITLDLRPTMDAAKLAAKLRGLGGSKSLGHVLRGAGFAAVDVALLHELVAADAIKTMNASQLAAQLKALPLTLTGTCGLARAISTAGGIAHAALTRDFMLRDLPHVFVAGEMLDWEAPTGGYLLQACFATGIASAEGIIARLKR